MPQVRSPLMTIIVAATHPGYGIGKGGSLPWPMLKGEMGFFSRVTKRVDPAHVSSGANVANAVIMGRKTWDSIPEKFRPLKGRVNIVVSSSMQQQLPRDNHSMEGPYVRSSLQGALDMLQGHQVGDQSGAEATKSNSNGGEVAGLPSNTRISRAFCIGGSSLYEAALNMKVCDRLLLTKIRKPFECDVFFPIDPEGQMTEDTGWGQRSSQQWAEWTGEPEEGRPKETQRTESDVPYEFCLYERDSNG